MARYSKIGVQIWGDEKFQTLSKPRPNAQTLWFFLLANPNRSALSGLFVAGERSLAEGLGWTLSSFRRHWDEIEMLKMASADWPRRLVWIPNMVRWDPPNGPNVAKFWGRQIKTLPECPLRREAEAFIDAFLYGFSDAIHKAFRDGLSMPSGMASRLPLPPQPPPTATASIPNDIHPPKPRADAQNHGLPTNPGTITSSADLSHWNSPPEPLDEETKAALHKAIGNPGLKRIPSPGSLQAGRHSVVDEDNEAEK